MIYMKNLKNLKKYLIENDIDIIEDSLTLDIDDNKLIIILNDRENIIIDNETNTDKLISNM